MISHLDRISNDIQDAETEEPLVWEYLWNDPLPSGMELPKGISVDKSGFVENFR